MADPQNGAGFDPGWNDPPMLAYASRQVYSNAKKPSLTKRVGLSWNASTPSQPNSERAENVLPASAPPHGPAPGPPPSCLPPKLGSPCEPINVETPIPSAPPSNYEPQALNPDSENSLIPQSMELSDLDVHSVLPPLYKLAEELFEGKEREKAEITKRLSLIESSWKEDKFPPDVKDKLHKITEAIKSGNADCADQLQRGLMVDHSALCSPWMAAIRKLLAEKRSNVST